MFPPGLDIVHFKTAGLHFGERVSDMIQLRSEENIFEDKPSSRRNPGKLPLALLGSPGNAVVEHHAAGLCFLGKQQPPGLFEQIPLVQPFLDLAGTDPLGYRTTAAQHLIKINQIAAVEINIAGSILAEQVFQGGFAENRAQHLRPFDPDIPLLGGLVSQGDKGAIPKPYTDIGVCRCSEMGKNSLGGIKVGSVIGLIGQGYRFDMKVFIWGFIAWS